ncbi:relaxase/mobilization nuclease domain-containing protein [bacterium]|nr:relaxase/mobilization nuclease domain-containing protein [bacterium]
MILKASQRSGGQDLAAHLMRMDENEHVELHEMRGFVAAELAGAFREAYAISRATKCRQYLFSLSLNPPEREAVPVAVFEGAIARVEKKLGLEGQPRAIVFHEKEGRRHAHCIWSRIDADTMTARPLPHFKRKLCDVSRELYREQGWKMPRGLIDQRQRDPRNFTLAEWQQAKRAGIEPRVLKETIQDCWAASDGRRSFEHALEEHGFFLSKGDRRGHVVLDYQGEVYALSRALNPKAKDVRQRLGDESALPSVEETHAKIASSMTPSIRRHIDEARAAFQKDVAVLAHEKTRIADRHRAERKALDDAQAARREAEEKTRAARTPRGLKGIWAWATGKSAKIRRENEADAARCAKRDEAERQAAIERQLRERRTLQTRVKALRSRQAEQLSELRRDVHFYMKLGRIEEPPRRKDRRLER